MRATTKGNLILLLTTILWGSTFVAQDAGMATMGPYTFQTVRTLLGGLVLIPVVMALDSMKKKKGSYVPLTRTQGKTLLVGGLVCGLFHCVASCLQQVGIAMGTPGGKAGFITAMYIIFVPLLGLFIGKRVKPVIWLCVPVALVGLFLLSMSGEELLAPPAAGDIVTLLCAFGFSFQILAVDHFAPKADCLKLATLEFLFSALFSSIPMLIFEGTAQLANIPITLIPLLYAGVLSCSVAYTLQRVGQKYTDPAVGSLIMSCEAVFAVLTCFAADLLGIVEDGRMSGREIVGCGIMMIAILLSQLDPGTLFAKMRKAK